MGLGMASNIARAGAKLQAWNRTAEKAAPLSELGATLCETPAYASPGPGHEPA